MNSKKKIIRLTRIQESQIHRLMEANIEKLDDVPAPKTLIRYINDYSDERIASEMIANVQTIQAYRRDVFGTVNRAVTAKAPETGPVTRGEFQRLSDIVDGILVRLDGRLPL